MIPCLFETDRQLITIDCRELFPPEPMERVLEAVASLDGDHAILMVHRKEPLPLYPKLEERQCSHETRILEDGTVQVLIQKTG